MFQLISYVLYSRLLQVTEVGGTGLPSWLALDEVTNSLLGVPSKEHQGQHHYLEVIAMETVAEEALSRARDMFTVHVTEDQPHSEHVAAVPYTSAGSSTDDNSGGDMAAKLKPVKCPGGSSITTASIVLDVDLEKMQPRDKAAMMEKMCHHLQMPTEMLRVVPVGQKSSMFDSSALVAGPGDVKNPENPGAILQWEVGCGNVYPNQMPLLQTLELTSGNGSMAMDVGHGVIGWHVTNNKVHAPTRLKRQVRRFQATPTPQPSVGAPTRQPVPTRVIPGTDGPSAVAPEVKPSRSKHPHKHRTKTKGRHPHHKTPHHSPKHTKTLAPLPSAVPIQPTSVIKVMPTTEPAAVTPDVPPMPIPSPKSTVETGIEGSITPPLPGVVTSKTPTEILPTRPTEAPGVTTEPVRPSKTDDAVTPSTKEPGVLEPTQPDTVPTEKFNYAPILKKHIQRIDVEVGEVFYYQIPKDTFYDYEDGNTRKLKLVFLTVEGMTVQKTSWVNLNDRKQVLYGIPMLEHEGRQEYILAAIDTSGRIAREPFEIDVKRRPIDQPISHELSIVLDMEYQHFMHDLDKRMDVAQKVASLYGDKDTKSMTVTRIAKGSVIYAWTNNSLPTKPCPTREIANLVSVLLTENNTLQEDAVRKMKPYRLLKAGAEQKGECAKDRDGGVWSENGEVKEVASKPRETTDDEDWINIVVPAVIIAAMLLLAALIACILYRKRRKGKLSDEDKHTFINRGIPVILPDELEDKPDPSSKPLILADEKPPLPPPEYPRSHGGSVPSSPGSNHKEPLLDSGDEDLASTPYHPPPPLTGTTGSRGSSSSRHRGTGGGGAYSRQQPYMQP